MKARSKERSTLLRVWRGGPGREERYDTYQVPYEEGMSVLDALRWIRSHLDSSLAIRYSCINANVCKTCVALVDGNVEYTCTARLREAPVTVKPLPKRSVIRDLVTDIAPREERLKTNRKSAE
jgi:succinate dehydrogenase/fumarate reductase-like Fe-S protein